MLNNNRLLLIFLVAIGLIDSIYLSVKSVNGSSLICSITHGCEKVLNSQFAHIGPVPVAFLGVLFYLILLVLLLLKNNWKIRNFSLIYIISLMGALGSIWFIALQIFVLKAYCQYCMVSDVNMILIFLGLCFGSTKRN